MAAAPASLHLTAPASGGASDAPPAQPGRSYAIASRSIVLWLTHKRMLPKWAGLALMGALTYAFDAPMQLVLFLVGLAVFFPSEYVVHRGVFHFFADKSAGKVLSRQHVEHHDRPDDLDYLFNDPRISVGIGTLYFLAYFGLTQNLGQAAALSLGNFVGLVYYEHVHFAAHRPGSRPWTPWSRYMKKYHLWHHYKHERHWYGVTSPAFDLAFGSHARPGEVDRSPTVRTLVPTDEQMEWMRR